jgi:hypothetical protein
MSSDLRNLIDLLSPLHEAQERGISPKTIERFYRCLIAVEGEIEELEDKISALEGDLEEAKAEQAESAKAPL